MLYYSFTLKKSLIWSVHPFIYPSLNEELGHRGLPLALLLHFFLICEQDLKIFKTSSQTQRRHSTLSQIRDHCAEHPDCFEKKYVVCLLIKRYLKKRILHYKIYMNKNTQLTISVHCMASRMMHALWVLRTENIFWCFTLVATFAYWACREVLG